MTVCNFCGKTLDELDSMNARPLCIRPLGYGSIFDGSTLEMQFCNTCLDALIVACQVSPLQEDDITIIDTEARPNLTLVRGDKE